MIDLPYPIWASVADRCARPTGCAGYASLTAMFSALVVAYCFPRSLRVLWDGSSVWSFQVVSYALVSAGLSIFFGMWSLTE